MPEDETSTTSDETNGGAATDAHPDRERGGEAGERDGAAGGQPHGEAEAGRDDQAAAPPSAWPDLDSYRERLRAEHAEWTERMSAVTAQLAALRPALIGIAAQQRALGILDDLEQLNEAVLGGAAMTQMVRLGYGLERYLALLWPAALDPRPGLAQPEGEGEYRVEVFLHVGQDGRPRIRVEGAKRLEAPLPTSRARLRGVLLGAIQNPKLVLAGDGGQGPADGAPAEGAAAASGAAEPAADADEDERPAAPRAGGADEQPPPEEQVIPLGPSPGADGGEAAQPA